MATHIEQIKSRIPVSSIIGRKVTLKNRGIGEFIGLCPFHHEKTPSFTVSDSKGFYHCFGCGMHGDIFSFLIALEGYDYKTALKILADLAGVTLPTYSKEQYDSHEKFYDILELITQIYQKNLYEKQGEEALFYIKKRGISDVTIKKYRLGFASLDRSSLIDELKKNFTLKYIQNTNLFNIREENKFIDPMRGRLIFPIMERSGKVIAFGGRIVGQGYPKYLNSSENPFFEKGKILYALNFAQSTMHKKQQVIIVEGYMDVLALAEIGIENVVAPLGTSLKIDQVKELWQFVDIPTMCMDSDKAGQKAAYRVAIEALNYVNPINNLKFIELSGCKDPDELIKNKGRTTAIKAIEKAINLSEFLFKFLKNYIGYETPEQQVLLKNKLENIIKQIKHHMVQNAYRSYFNDQLFKLRCINKKLQNKSSTVQYQIKTEYDYYHLKTALYILMQKNDLLNDNEIYDTIIKLDIHDQKLDKLRNFLLNQNNENTDYEISELLKEIKLMARVIEPQVKAFSYKEILTRALELHSLYIVQQQIKRTEQDLIIDSSESAFLRLMALKKHEAKLKKQLNII